MGAPHLAAKVSAAELHYDGRVFTLPVVEGSEHERGLEIGRAHV